MLFEDLLKEYEDVSKIFINMPKDIRERCSVKVFSQGDIIIKKDDGIKFVYLICKGRIKVINEFENGVLYAFGELSPVNFIGDIELLADEHTAAATNRAITECTVIKIYKEDVLSWIKVDTTLPLVISKMYAKRMYEQSRKKGEHIIYPGLLKVIMVLISSVENILILDEGILIEKKRQQIADEIGVSIKTVNRSIEKLKNDDLVSIVKGKIYINQKQYDDLVKIFSEGL